MAIPPASIDTAFAPAIAPRIATGDDARPFASFWQAGFEGADHVNGSARPLSMGRMTGHLARARGDYRRLARLGIRTVRESAGWREAGAGPRFDFASVARREDCARRENVQILWTFFHYGLPSGVDLFSDCFVARFAEYSAALARFLRPLHDDDRVPVYTPINEISFLAWAVCETGLLHPHLGDRASEGYALKKRLVRATIAACDAIRAEDPSARFLFVDPLIHIAGRDAAGVERARGETGFQFQAWDMLCGRLEPELGGQPRHLDLIGLNYYPHNQWDVDTRETLRWPDDPRRAPLSTLLLEVHARYRRPLILSETSHMGPHRGAWLLDVTAHAARARERGARIDGICLYPALDRPDWEAPDDWHDSGLWRVDPLRLDRTLDTAYADALAKCQQRIGDVRSQEPSGVSMDAIIVFSHLRWNFVYQRPQHLLSRVARRWPIIFVEEPVAGDPGLEVSRPADGVTVLRPSMPGGGSGFDDAAIDAIGPSIVAHLVEAGVRGHAVWFYTPMALPFLDLLSTGLESPRAIVYDCMDELTGFRHAPPQLAPRERRLIEIANVTFTGGPSLYDAKRPLGRNVVCLPSSVDARHFARASDPTIAAEAVSALPRPRLGFFGVIDERLDIDLIDAVARAQPDWQIVMVGPVVKIDPATLPVHPNIHYLPQQRYEDLPALMAGWDVCLLPFARNEATRFISPTKTLEYMAAHKPVVGTAIEDVRRLYAAGVAIAETPSAFVDACRDALEESAGERRRRIEAQTALVEATSWERAADMVVRELGAAFASGPTPPAEAYLRRPPVVPLPAQSPRLQEDARTPCLILGAGPTGLSAAYHYGEDCLLVDANDRVGGWCRSIEDKGFIFDHAGHIMFSRDPDVLSLYRTLLGDNLHWQDREAWVYSKGVHTRYPFQGALYGLPPDVLKECLVGAIEARFGPLDEDAAERGAGPVAARRAAPGPTPVADCCADGCVPDAPVGDEKDRGGERLAAVGGRPPANFEEFIYRVWGRGVAKHFAIPYNRKLWTVPLSEMETSWLGGRVPLPNLEEMIEGALHPVPKPVGPNARFGYPLQGGFQALMDGFLPHLKGELRLSTRLVRLHPGARIAEFDDGRRVGYETLISTIPLPELVRMIGDEAPEAIRRAAGALRHVSVRCVNIGVARSDLTDKHWIYYPEDTIFHRIFVQGNASPHNNPANGFGLTCEISYSPAKPLPCDGVALIQRCVDDCRRVGMLREDDAIVTANLVDMPYAYVVYDHARAENVARIRAWLARHDILLAGRYSEWEYYNSDHAFIAGRRAAEAVRAIPAESARSA